MVPVEQKTGSTTQRLLWFVLLWLGGVATVALVAAVLRLWLHP
jgi:hypothetical protein